MGSLQKPRDKKENEAKKWHLLFVRMGYNINIKTHVDQQNVCHQQGGFYFISVL